MEKKKGIALLCTAAAAMGMISGCTVSTTLPSESETEQTETSAPQGPYRPQDDFYMYVNEESLENAVFEYGEYQAGSVFDDNVINDQLEDLVNTVVEGSGYEVGSEEYIIQQAYNLYLNYNEENASLPDEIDEIMHQIDEISDHRLSAKL